MKHVLFNALKFRARILQVFMVLLCLHASAFAKSTNEVNQSLPTTIPAIWQAVDEHMAAIKEAIATNQLEQIHHHAFAINDLMKSLPALSPDLSAAQLDAVKKEIGYIDALAERLDKTGDAKDKEGTQANFAKLQKIIESIRANYSIAGKENSK